MNRYVAGAQNLDFAVKSRFDTPDISVHMRPLLDFERDIRASSSVVRRFGIRRNQRHAALAAIIRIILRRRGIRDDDVKIADFRKFH